MTTQKVINLETYVKLKFRSIVQLSDEDNRS